MIHCKRQASNIQRRGDNRASNARASPQNKSKYLDSSSPKHSDKVGMVPRGWLALGVRCSTFVEHRIARLTLPNLQLFQKGRGGLRLVQIDIIQFVWVRAQIEQLDTRCLWVDD